MPKNRFDTGRSSEYAQNHMRPFRSVAGAGPLLVSDQVVYADASGGAFALTLPDPSLFVNNTLTVQKTDASGNAVTISPFAAETINGASSFSLPAQYDSGSFFSDGTNWSVFPGTGGGSSATVDPRDIYRYSMIHQVGG